MSRNRRVCAATLLILLVVCGPAVATQISVQVDPGPVGPVTGSVLSIDLTQLAVVQLPQGVSTIDIQFDDSKYVDLRNVAVQDWFTGLLVGEYTPSHSSMEFAEGDGHDYRDMYYLLNQGGEPNRSWYAITNASFDGNFNLGLIYNGQSLLDLQGARISGVRLSLDASGEFQFTTATLTLDLSGSGTMRIGRVPEPATAALAILAAASAAFACRRRTLPRSE